MLACELCQKKKKKTNNPISMWRNHWPQNSSFSNSSCKKQLARSKSKVSNVVMNSKCNLIIHYCIAYLSKQFSLPYVQFTIGQPTFLVSCTLCRRQHLWPISHRYMSTASHTSFLRKKAQNLSVHSVNWFQK